MELLNALALASCLPASRKLDPVSVALVESVNVFVTAELQSVDAVHALCPLL